MKFSPQHANPQETEKQKKAKAKTAQTKAPEEKIKPKKNFFIPDIIDVDTVDEAVESKKMRKVLRLVQVQVMVVVALTVFLMAGQPFFQPLYQYYAMDSSRHIVQLVALQAPNMTNKAVLSWAANSITEIMTFGFGDYTTHLIDQKSRFTPEGWASFVKAFYKMDIGQVFRERQLVLTTVPSDQPVIISQGVDPDHVYPYQWKVQMPIIMTYATNNNATRKDTAMVTLTLVRVPATQSPGGIAIKAWMQ